MDLKKLQKRIPFRWKKGRGGSEMAYISARDVMDLLDESCGAENWQRDHKVVDGKLYGGVGIKINDEWVWKWDCGVESNFEAEKGESSDAFKRAAVNWGVGRFLYSLGDKKTYLANEKRLKESKLSELKEARESLGMTSEDLQNKLKSRYGKKWADLTIFEVEDLLEHLSSLVNQKPKPKAKNK